MTPASRSRVAASLPAPEACVATSPVEIQLFAVTPGVDGAPPVRELIRQDHLALAPPEPRRR